MRARIWLIPVAALVMETAISAESMRCRNRIIGDGDPKAKVAELCGKPSYTETRTIYRSGVPRANLDVVVDSGRRASISDSELLIHDRSHVEVTVDVWVYNLGRSRLMREVVFEDSRVVEINSLGRGY